MKPRPVVLFPPGVTFCYQIFCFHVVKPLMPILALLPMLCICEKPNWKNFFLNTGQIQCEVQKLNPYCAVCNYRAFSLFTSKCCYISVSLFMCTTLQWHQISHSYRFPIHPLQPNCNFSASVNMPISCMPHASIVTISL